MTKRFCPMSPSVSVGRLSCVRRVSAPLRSRLAAVAARRASAPLEGVKKMVGRRKRLPHKKVSPCAPKWDRRFRLSTRRSQRFFHSFQTGRFRTLDCAFSAWVPSLPPSQRLRLPDKLLPQFPGINRHLRAFARHAAAHPTVGFVELGFRRLMRPARLFIGFV